MMSVPGVENQISCQSDGPGEQFFPAALAEGQVPAGAIQAANDFGTVGYAGPCNAPGTVDTPWVQRITSGYDDPEAARGAMEGCQPHGRLVSPEEIAAMAAYLASDEAAMVVDGGMTAR